jgi:hypothetical protein
MKTVLLSIIVLLTPLISLAQQKDTVLITAGHPILESDKLKAYKARYDFFRVKDGAETKIGGMDENFMVLTKDGQKQGLRICNIVFGANTILDSGLCYINGLKPIYHKSIQTKKKISLDFHNELVSGFIVTQNESGDKKESINHTSTVSLFDSYYESMVAQTVKLKKGFVFKFAEYIYERGGTVWSVGEVIGDEEIAGKRIWTVMMYEKGARGETTRTTTYKINEQDRSVLSYEYKTSNGSMLARLRS